MYKVHNLINYEYSIIFELFMDAYVLESIYNNELLYNNEMLTFLWWSTILLDVDFPKGVYFKITSNNKKQDAWIV